jgi:hypothetical protein
MRRMDETDMPAMRVISPAELTLVSGGAIIEGDGSHGVKQHVPGRLEPDDSERGTIAGSWDPVANGSMP